VLVHMLFSSSKMMMIVKDEFFSGQSLLFVYSKGDENVTYITPPHSRTVTRRYFSRQRVTVLDKLMCFVVEEQVMPLNRR